MSRKSRALVGRNPGPAADTVTSATVMTLHGTEAGMDYVEMVCPHGTTADAIDPPVGPTLLGGEDVERALDRSVVRHRTETGCDCQRLVVVLAGPRELD